MKIPVSSSALLLAAWLTSSIHAVDPARSPSRQELIPTAAERDARLGWWREARFGMFVHWGVYSDLSGTWKGKNHGGYAEHIQRMAKIPIPVYHKEVAGKFNPTEFNADEWVRLAKEAGMGYFVITAKHHDGFAMYDSKVSDATIIKATPFARDPMKDLKAACQKYGIKFGFYYSHAFDWGEENGPGNDWDFQNPGGDKLLHGANWWENFPEFLPKARKYVDEKAIPQIQELIANYDPDILWFDTPHKLPPEENQRILAAVRKAKPSLVVNSRLISGCGDYQSTCDRPAEFPPQSGDWEGIPTTNESYGYNANDHSHKSVTHFIRLLAKSAARGGNQLMNIGPMGDGKIDGADVAILKGIGAWWKVNGESIRGTTRTPLAVQAWGESTRKGNKLYLHVFQWPTDGKLIVGGLKTDVTTASLLTSPNNALETIRSGLDLTITVPKTAPDTASSVVVLECASAPAADAVRLISNTVPVNTLHVFDSKLAGKLRFGPGKKNDDVVHQWTNPKDHITWPVRINESGTFAVEIEYDAPAAAKSGRIVEGDAGKESVADSSGAAGVYAVTIGDQEFTKPVVSGNARREALGSVTLKPGTCQITIQAREITGEELFRPRRLSLTPVSAEPMEVSLHVDESKPGPAIPADFIGFSYEKNVLALDHFKPSNTAMVNLMRHLGGGVLRFGANYVETTRWEPEAPRFFSKDRSVIGLRELEDLYGFAKTSGWTIIHGLNLGANDPEMAAAEAAEAQRIGGKTLIAFEIGNEPEHYGKTWRPADYSYQDFSREISNYLKVMRPKVPRIPLAGPATTSNFPWFTGFIHDFRSDLVMTTRHNYPLAAASQNPADSRFASVENLLSPSTAAAWRKLIGQHQQASKSAGLPFRVGEAGSASSGGKAGVSDVFASALWCADYLFDLAELGVAGVNFHGGFNCRGYTSFCALKTGGYHAHGNYYGMLFFRQAAPGRVIPLKITGEGVNLTCHAVLGDDGLLRVALINKDLRTNARVAIKLANRPDQATVMRLGAPSIDAKTGITLGGAGVASDGTWQPKPSEPITASKGEFQLDVHAASAAMLVVDR